MKKIITTCAIVLGLGLTSFAEPNGGGLFQRGTIEPDRSNNGPFPALPAHGQNNNQSAPLGSGILVLTAFGRPTL